MIQTRMKQRFSSRETGHLTGFRNRKTGHLTAFACWLILPAFACWLLVGCKSSTGMTASTTEIMKTEEAFFVSVLDRSFRFDTFSARLNLDFSGMQYEFSSKVQLKMIRNDRMQISIQPFLGIEAFRIEIADDSIKILDRMKKRFVADSYQHLKREMDIDFNFHNLQALFTNQIFIPGQSQLSTKQFRQFRITKSPRSAEFQHKDRSATLYTFVADGDEKLLSTQIANEAQNRQLTWDYSQFQAIDNQAFPMKMAAQLTSGDQIQGTTTLIFSTPVINSPLTLDFVIPSGYNRVTLNQIIQSLVK